MPFNGGQDINLDFLTGGFAGNDTTNDEISIVEMIQHADSAKENSSFVTPYMYVNTAFNATLIVAYSILFVVSLFGNSMVCYAIFRNKRMHTVTNLFIVNLALADILVTLMNLPFQIPRHLLDDWPFGDVICHMHSFSLMVSVYVSTLTMTAIALDRHQVIIHPLRPRISIPAGVVIVVVIWIAACSFSIPFGIYQKVKRVHFFTKIVMRCTTEYPSPKIIFEQSITIATLLLQYVTPLVVIAAAYGRVVQRLWVRTSLGAVTHDQLIFQAKAKRKSIQMLITVVILFGICWMPLNLYHIITDLHPDKKSFKHDSTVFFMCHWIAISSTCYNPFIYCWLNEAFRREVKKIFICCFRQTISSHRDIDSHGTRASRGRHVYNACDTKASLRHTPSATIECNVDLEPNFSKSNNGARTPITTESFKLTTVIEITSYPTGERVIYDSDAV